MGNLSTIRADIERDFRRNGVKAITGDLLQARLLDIVGYLEDQEARKEYLTFEAAEDNVNVYFHDPDGTDASDLKVSVDGGATWQQIHATTEDRGSLVATLANAGDKALLKTASDGRALGYYSEEMDEVIGPSLNVNGRCYVYGNAMSLLFEDFSNRNAVPAYALLFLFSDYNGEIDNADLLFHPTKRLLLPATTLAQGCYSYMFQNCTGLTSAPELPATTLAQSCYNGMFSGCTGLTSAPELPATTLAEFCYSSMFSGCTGLTSAPELPVTTLAQGCYSSMFQNCTGLTSAPELPVTTLAQGCYSSMFQNCTGLTSAPELPATTLAEFCYNGMFSGCTGLTSAPELPATTLAQGCYSYMFQNCTGLERIKAMFLTTPGNAYTASWVRNVKSTGIFIKNSATTWDVTGNSGIPTGWTVQTASA